MALSTPSRSFLANPLKSQASLSEGLIETTSMPKFTPSVHNIDSTYILRWPETLGELIEVRGSEGKGLGVFALRDIAKSTVLLWERPFVILKDTGTRADPLDATVAALSPHHRESFLSLWGYSCNARESKNRSIVYSNGYSIMDDIATGVFETASRINHSCIPNSTYHWREELGRMVFMNTSKLLEGDEVTVHYGHTKGQLKRIYGFECQCGGCTGCGSVGSTSAGSDVGDDENETSSLDTIVGKTVKGESMNEGPSLTVHETGAIHVDALEVEAGLGHRDDSLA